LSRRLLHAAFSVTDADSLLELIYSSSAGPVVVVAGQAVNFWADRYKGDEKQLLKLRPFVSRDLDLIGDIADAYRLAEKTHSDIEKPRRGAASPVLANIDIRTAGAIRSVQFLRSIRGVTTEEVVEHAVPFTIKKTEMLFSDPITLLKAKLHNLYEMPQHGRNDSHHVQILRLCVPIFLSRQFRVGASAAEEILADLQRVIGVSRSRVGRRWCRKERLDWRELMPMAELGRTKSSKLQRFRDMQLPRVFAKR
jgi:hypothetical protein